MDDSGRFESPPVCVRKGKPQTALKSVLCRCKFLLCTCCSRPASPLLLSWGASAGLYRPWKCPEYILKMCPFLEASQSTTAYSRNPIFHEAHHFISNPGFFFLPDNIFWSSLDSGLRPPLWGTPGGYCFIVFSCLTFTKQPHFSQILNDNSNNFLDKSISRSCLCYFFLLLIRSLLCSSAVCLYLILSVILVDTLLLVSDIFQEWATGADESIAVRVFCFGSVLSARLLSNVCTTHVPVWKL